MSEKCCCIICKKEFSIKGIHTHYERLHGSVEDKKKYSSGYNHRYNDSKYRKSLKEGLKNSFNNKLGFLKDFDVFCNTCNKSFTVKEREKHFPSKEKYFCSRSCANKRIITKDHREKTSKSLKRNKDIKVNCKHCDVIFVTASKTKQYCSVMCSNKHRAIKRRKNNPSYKNYRIDCAFKFDLKDYPEEFNFSLIESYGWYKPKNRGNNLNGVSRDHIVSVKYGFENNVEPSIISHPANCQLMRHNDNVSKYTKNDLTVEELLKKIKEWNEKYQ
jgi:uncharacterized Zn finger protein (UPF0148 family)